METYHQITYHTNMSFSVINFLNGEATPPLTFNPIDAHMAQLRSLADIGDQISTDVGGLKTAMLSLSGLCESVSTYMTSEIESLQTKLPILAAASSIDRAAKGVSGVILPDSPTGAFALATEGIRTLPDIIAAAVQGLLLSVETQMSTVTGVPGATAAQKLAAIATESPPTHIPDPLNPGSTIENPDYANWQAANPEKAQAITGSASSVLSLTSSMSGVVDSVKQSESAALSGSISRLKTFAFAKFASKMSSPEVTAVLGKFTTPPTVSNVVEEKLLAGQVAIRRRADSVASPPPGLVVDQALEQEPPPKPKAPNTTVIDVGSADRKQKLLESFQKLEQFSQTLVAYSNTVIKPYVQSLGHMALWEAYAADKGNNEKRTAWENAKATFSHTEPYRSYQEAKDNCAKVRSLLEMSATRHNQNNWNPLWNLDMASYNTTNPIDLVDGSPRQLSFWVIT